MTKCKHIVNNNAEPAADRKARIGPGRDDLPGACGTDVALRIGGSAMVSIWWLLAAFLLGGSAGMLLMVLMQLVGSLPESRTPTIDLNGTPG